MASTPASKKAVTGTSPASNAAASDAATAEVLGQKEAIRHEALGRRQELRAAQRSAKSRDICNQLLNILKTESLKGKGGGPATIAAYAALRFEVDLDRFIRGAYAFGYRIAFPCMIPNDPNTGALCMRSVSCNNYLGGNVPFIVDPRRPWGPVVTEEHQAYISTPAGATRRFIPSRVKGSVPPKDDTRFPVVPPKEIDLVIVPATAFDKHGHRLGYGRGSYDRYLPQLHDDCRLLGVAYAEQEVDEVPYEAHDIAIPNFIIA